MIRTYPMEEEPIKYAAVIGALACALATTPAEHVKTIDECPDW